MSIEHGVCLSVCSSILYLPIHLYVIMFFRMVVPDFLFEYQKNKLLLVCRSKVRIPEYSSGIYPFIQSRGKDKSLGKSK